MTGKNIGFNDELHDIFVKELDESEFTLRLILKSFIDLYPNRDRGPEGRVSRNMASALRCIKDAQAAMKEIREKEAEK